MYACKQQDILFDLLVNLIYQKTNITPDIKPRAKPRINNIRTLFTSRVYNLDITLLFLVNKWYLILSYSKDTTTDHLFIYVSFHRNQLTFADWYHVFNILICNSVHEMTSKLSFFFVQKTTETSPRIHTVFLT